MVKNSKYSTRDLRKIHQAVASEAIESCGEDDVKQHVHLYALQALLNMARCGNPPAPGFIRPGSFFGAEAALLGRGPALQGKGKSKRPAWHNCGEGMLRKFGPDTFVTIFPHSVRRSCRLCSYGLAQDTLAVLLPESFLLLHSVQFTVDKCECNYSWPAGQSHKAADGSCSRGLYIP